MSYVEVRAVAGGNPLHGYKVVFVPFSGGKPSGPAQDVTGFLDANNQARKAHDFNIDRSASATFPVVAGLIIRRQRRGAGAALTTASAERKFIRGFSLAAGVSESMLLALVLHGEGSISMPVENAIDKNIFRLW